ncbi:hypothetical protein RIF29_15202 [Crotalaria pallida]|uniref:Uncharacterized protein n=1 Tax=Crotalaria pallida TaxID=3830 RepID=A0AAN9FGT8_CROPI
MSTSMASSKAAHFIGLFLFVFLSSQVVAHHNDEEHGPIHFNDKNDISFQRYTLNDPNPKDSDSPIISHHDLVIGIPPEEDDEPPYPSKTTLIKRAIYYTQPSGYIPSKLNNIENMEHGYAIKHDSTKPAEIDSKTSTVFMTKTTPRMKNGDKIGYYNSP